MQGISIFNALKPLGLLSRKVIRIIRFAKNWRFDFDLKVPYNAPVPRDGAVRSFKSQSPKYAGGD